MDPSDHRQWQSAQFRRQTIQRRTAQCHRRRWQASDRQSAGADLAQAGLDRDGTILPNDPRRGGEAVGGGANVRGVQGTAKGVAQRAVEVAGPHYSGTRRLMAMFRRTRGMPGEHAQDNSGRRLRACG